MATTYHELSGKAVWAKLTKPDDKFTPAWSIGLVLDDEAYSSFKALKKQYGLRMNLKDTDNTPGFEDGEEYITLRRKVEKKTAKGDWVNEPPVVEDDQGNTIGDLVGNGSTVTVEFLIYSFTYQGKEGHAAEFTKVIVHDLVRYEKPTDTPVPANAATQRSIASSETPDGLPPVKTPRKF